MQTRTGECHSGEPSIHAPAPHPGAPACDPSFASSDKRGAAQATSSRCGVEVLHLDTPARAGSTTAGVTEGAQQQAAGSTRASTPFLGCGASDARVHAKHSRVPLMDLGALMRLSFRRWLPILLVALAGAGAAWLTVRDAQPTYERELRFAVRPKPDIPPTDLVEATGTLATRESPLMQTVSSLVSSDEVRAEMRRRAGLAPATPAVKQTSVLTPGSNVIVVTLQGNDESALRRLGAALPPAASAVVADAYELLRLQLVSNSAPIGPVSPNVKQTVAIGALLGLLVALAAVFAEGTIRSTRGGGEAVLESDDFFLRGNERASGQGAAEPPSSLSGSGLERNVLPLEPFGDRRTTSRTR
jgi:capsular polysaccharide biosynthesis protein